MKLDQFLKFIGVVQTGGEAKMIIKSGKISVNGIIENRRGRKLIHGDQINFANETYIVPNSDPLGRKLARSIKRGTSVRKPVIAGNWKMNMTCSEAIEYMRIFIPLLKEIPKEREVVIAPPFTALYPLSEFVKNNNDQLSLSSQNVHWEDSGAYTAEVSPLMLNELSIKCAIVGHSEPRKYFSESDEQINKRAQSAQDHNLIPIVCVGETFQQRELGEAERVIRRQIDQGLEGIDVKRLIVAYEPIWAIGTGKTCEANEANRICGLIRKWIGFENVIIQYGGSVKSNNIDEIMSMSDIDGVLVGGASLDPTNFARIANYEKI